jgi:hypothetical protein
MKTWIMSLSLAMLAGALGCQETPAPEPTVTLGENLSFYARSSGDYANDGGVMTITECQFTNTDAVIIAEVIEESTWQHDCPEGVLQDYRAHIATKVRLRAHVSGNQVPDEMWVHFGEPDWSYSAGEVMLLGLVFDGTNFLVAGRVNVDAEGATTDQKNVGETQVIVDLPTTLTELRSKMTTIDVLSCPEPTQATQEEYITYMRTHHPNACNGTGPIEDDGRP